MPKKGVPQPWDRGHKGKGAAITWLRAHINYQGDECLIWPFSRNPETGYGHLGFSGKQYYAHRLMCALAHGPISPDKPTAAHSCGRGHDGCVNPNHLSWKSIADNLMDRREHGTVRYNPNGHAGKLTPEQITQIRAEKGITSQYELARRYGVKRAAIQYWHKHDRPHSPPQTHNSRSYRYAQKKKEQAADRHSNG